eukprot:CAMPEP_0170194588 /NCGR_PEP_ID=MMETSP0040_2-20121228/59618_1 /TAXON_ID=641309 /ORGANISM="Lotharella oceanica, Strain CCMP622" /LENGTH=134 /DNA_ID=CAMNT_0010443539 /DNA_START=164 /DNA_END=568 /DNA_ORIENTATION=-
MRSRSEDDIVAPDADERKKKDAKAAEAPSDKGVKKPEPRAIGRHSVVPDGRPSTLSTSEMIGTGRNRVDSVSIGIAHDRRSIHRPSDSTAAPSTSAPVEPTSDEAKPSEDAGAASADGVIRADMGDEYGLDNPI